MSGAVHRTDISFPVMVADALGVRGQFRVPNFDVAGGLPINLERLLSKLSTTFGKRVDWWEVGPAAAVAQALMDDTEDYWERGRGTWPTLDDTPHDNLAVWGFEVVPTPE